MHAHSYTHVIHAWCFNDLLFLPSAGQRHQPSAVISGSSGPEPGPNTCIAHAPIAHSCMHACIPACIPPGSCVQYPRKRADPQSASEEKVGVCMHEPFLFFSSCIRGISIFLFAFQADSRGGETERPAAA